MYKGKRTFNAEKFNDGIFVTTIAAICTLLIFFAIQLLSAIDSASNTIIEPPIPSQNLQTLDLNNLQIEFGTPELVYDFSSQSCEASDFSDAPARVFVDKSGNLQLISSHYRTRRFTGPNLDTLTHSCPVVLDSHKDADPNKNNDYEWLHTPFYLNGTIYAFIHNEFHGWEHGPGCTNGWPHCWYNSVTFATSTDEGTSYQHAEAPMHTILTYSSPYNPDNNTGGVGFFEPSNIIRKDSYYYFFAFHAEPGIPGGSSLFRSTNIADPNSWYYWNGNGYSPIVDKKAPNCTHIPNFESYISVTYNDYLEAYLGMRCQWGTCFFSVSEDLIHWDPKRTFGNGMCTYASFIQPGEESTNFEHTDRSPWIYYMSCDNCSNSCSGSDRDTKRMRVRFSKPEDTEKYDLIDLRFSEHSGNKSLDASYYGNSAQISGQYSWSSQNDSRHFVHLSSGATALIPHNTSLNITHQISIHTAIKLDTIPSTGSYAQILDKTQGGTPDKRNFGVYITDSGKVHFSINDGTGYKGAISQSSLVPNQWYDLVITFNDTTNQTVFFINNSLDSTTSIDVSLPKATNTAPITIGGQSFSGSIDHITLYNHITNTIECTCDGKTCGQDNGCGTKCTNCPSGQTCDQQSWTCKANECTPSCIGKVCGDEDGCGGTCLDCPENQTCNNQSWTCQAVCTPSCESRECGSNGCGGTCGICESGFACSNEGVCIESEILPGDINNDGKVSVSDYSLFISDYLYFTQYGSIRDRSDFNNDNKITVSDYALFISYYLSYISK